MPRMSVAVRFLSSTSKARSSFSYRSEYSHRMWRIAKLHRQEAASADISSGWIFHSHHLSTRHRLRRFDRRLHLGEAGLGKAGSRTSPSTRLPATIKIMATAKAGWNRPRGYGHVNSLRAQRSPHALDCPFGRRPGGCPIAQALEPVNHFLIVLFDGHGSICLSASIARGNQQGAKLLEPLWARART